MIDAGQIGSRLGFLTRKYIDKYRTKRVWNLCEKNKNRKNKEENRLENK